MAVTGLSMNILWKGNRSPAQKGFFKNSAGNLLPALRFHGGLYNFGNYNFLQWPSNTFYRFGNDQILPKTCAAETASLRKLKTT